VKLAVPEVGGWGIAGICREVAATVMGLRSDEIALYGLVPAHLDPILAIP
jgi:hypothetical protein